VGLLSRRSADAEHYQGEPELSFSSWSYAGLEKRSQPRVSVRFGVVLLSPSHPQGLVGEIVNVSGTGAGLEVAGPAAEVPWPDEEVTVIIRSTSGPVRLVMRVVREHRFGARRSLGLVLTNRTRSVDRWRFIAYAKRLVGLGLRDTDWT